VIQNRPAIAFDFDGTLLSGLTAIHDFVRENHKRMRFVIVTHRSRRETASIANELTQVGLDIEMFERVIPCPDRIIMDFEEAQQMRRMARLPSTSAAKNLFPGEDYFVNWKGETAKRLRCAYLVDDIAWLAKPGCDANGVIFIPAAEFPNGVDGVSAPVQQQRVLI
jgi:hypothetical protein